MSKPMPSLSRETLKELEERQVAFFQARLVSPKAEQEWRSNMGLLISSLGSSKVGALVTPSALSDLLDALLSTKAVDEAFRPLAERALERMRAAMEAETRTVGVFVPDEARKKIERWLELPGLLSPRLVREVAEQEALEVVMRDVLHDALKEFLDKVNPFFAEWGLPSLLKRLVPFGLGGVNKGFESMRGEFERRLEPEIRRFLQGFSKKALRQVAEFVIDRADTPPFIALRKRIFEFTLEQKVRELLLAPGGSELARSAFVDTVAAGLTDSSWSARRRGLLQDAVAARADSTLAELLSEGGVLLPLEPLIDALARATWPMAVMLLSSEPAKAWLADLIKEFFAQLDVTD